ncbi:MAG: hypothetical protein LWX11_05335 [Firmicutes bacterium]|nr:hypothetical protein [Bacillota bacterium]
MNALVEQLGQALVRALAEDEASRALARKIHEEGFEVALMIEATVALHPVKGDASEEAATEGERPVERPSAEGAESLWSEEDKAFLRTFKIALD